VVSHTVDREILLSRLEIVGGGCQRRGIGPAFPTVVRFFRVPKSYPLPALLLVMYPGDRSLDPYLLYLYTRPLELVIKCHKVNYHLLI